MQDIPEEVVIHLAKAPAMVFLLVAAADGNIDKKEIRKFSKILQDQEYEPIFTAMETTGIGLLETIVSIKNNKTDPGVYLVTLNKILNSLLPEEYAYVYKLMLIKLAKTIAEASGGLFGIFGNKISKEEKLALAFIASTLEILPGQDKPEPSSKNSATVDIDGKSVQLGPLDRSEPAFSIPNDYKEVADLPDNLYPALKTNEWGAKPDAEPARRKFYDGKDNSYQQYEPYLGWAIDNPTNLIFLNHENIVKPLTIEQVHAQAIKNLQKRLADNCQWREVHFDDDIDGQTSTSGLVFEGDYFASEAILVEKVMKQAHEKLDSALLMAIAPCRGQLYVSRLLGETKATINDLVFAGAVIKNYFNTHQAPISPIAWIVRRGQLIGHVGGLERLIKIARDYAEKEVQAENDSVKIIAATRETDQGHTLLLHLIIDDLEAMMKNLQFIIRNYADEYLARDEFNGQVHVVIKILDHRFNPAGIDVLKNNMNDMFKFLTRHFIDLGLNTKSGNQIKLKYKLIS